MSCKSCYEINIQCCDDIIIKGGLLPYTDYFVVVNKPGKSNVYQRKITSDDAGFVTIPKSMFPNGFLAAGEYLHIELREGDSYLTKAEMSFPAYEYYYAGTIQYDCVMAYLVEFDSDDIPDINAIQ